MQNWWDKSRIVSNAKLIVVHNRNSTLELQAETEKLKFTKVADFCPRNTFSETIRHRWYQAESKYWWFPQGLAAWFFGPNLQACSRAVSYHIFFLMVKTRSPTTVDGSFSHLLHRATQEIQWFPSLCTSCELHCCKILYMSAFGDF